jgi:hypothetical protein
MNQLDESSEIFSISELKLLKIFNKWLYNNNIGFPQLLY